MSPLEYELNWELVWNVLMLDAFRAMQRELCIPGDMGLVQACLRETLEDHYRAHELNFSAGLLYMRLAAKLRSCLANEETALYVLAWGDYLSDLVHRRVGEFIWSIALYALDELEHPDWLETRFQQMRSEKKEIHKQIESVIEMVRITDHDRIILDRINWSEESLQTHLDLVAGYNAFCRIWHQNTRNATLDELDELYAFGRALAQKKKIVETQLCYPGVWEAGPQHKLLRLGSG